jgi:hypothetical protein
VGEIDEDVMDLIERIDTPYTILYAVENAEGYLYFRGGYLNDSVEEYQEGLWESIRSKFKVKK